MSISLTRWLQAFVPAPTSVSTRERLRSSAGALCGIGLTGLVSAFLMSAVPGAAAGAVWLIAPMGASAVLLFGVPSSPLAQPWSILGGNLVAALIGVTCARLIDDPVAAASAAIFFAIATMFALRCLHPPSGAVALTAVLGGTNVHAAGYAFVIAPVALDSVLLLGVALLFNNATGRRYPHPTRSEVERPDARSRAAATGAPFDAIDLQAALKDYDQVLDVSAGDLASLFRETEMHALRRRTQEVRCRDLIAREVPSVEFATELDTAWALLRQHRVDALPVLDRARHVIGIVTRSDFLARADLPDHRSLAARLKAFLARNDRTHSDRDEVVGQIMTAPARTALDVDPAVALVPSMTDPGLRQLPVVDAEAKFVGMVTQADLVGALSRICLSSVGGSVEPRASDGERGPPRSSDSVQGRPRASAS